MSQNAKYEIGKKFGIQMILSSLLQLNVSKLPIFTYIKKKIHLDI